MCCRPAAEGSAGPVRFELPVHQISGPSRVPIGDRCVLGFAPRHAFEAFQTHQTFHGAAGWATPFGWEEFSVLVVKWAGQFGNPVQIGLTPGGPWCDSARAARPPGHG